jgi:hypothetical protein
MNEIITQLKEEAFKTTEWDQLDYDKILEKVVMLTVKKCISVLEKEIYKSIDNEGDEIWADLILNKHFGVT